MVSLVRQLGKAVFAASDVFLPAPLGPRILIYHQVGARLGRQMEVKTEDFIWQLDWLAQNREVVTLDEALQRWDEKDSESLVVLTFDDGYQDTYSRAFPLMKERGIPFTLYLATKDIETGAGTPGAEPLTWTQVKKMIDTGLVTVGAHTHSHPDLRTLSSDEITGEIETSNHLIYSRLGSPPSHFAYPWGYWAPNGDEIVRRKYSSAVLGATTLALRQKHSDYLIHRYPVQRDDGTHWFQRRLKKNFMLEESVRRLLRGYRGP